MTPAHRSDLAAAEALLRYGFPDYAEAVLAKCPCEPARAALAALRAGDEALAAEHVAEALAGLREGESDA